MFFFVEDQDNERHSTPEISKLSQWDVFITVFIFCVIIRKIRLRVQVATWSYTFAAQRRDAERYLLCSWLQQSL